MCGFHERNVVPCTFICIFTIIQKVDLNMTHINYYKVFDSFYGADETLMKVIYCVSISKYGFSKF